MLQDLFPMEVEGNGVLPFIDVHFSRKVNGTVALHREVLQKPPTHTNGATLSKSHHDGPVRREEHICTTTTHTFRPDQIIGPEISKQSHTDACGSLRH